MTGFLVRPRMLVSLAVASGLAAGAGSRSEGRARAAVPRAEAAQSVALAGTAEAEPPGPSDCCLSSELPGCSDAQALGCICSLDPYCCQVEFDSLCATRAMVCGAACAAAQSGNDCCSASDTPGCSEPAVNACLCALDVACCAGAFDELCAAEARSECGASCPAPAPESDCCRTSSTPGCGVPEVQACVCGIDPFCCASRFDETCAALAETLCSASCQS